MPVSTARASSITDQGLPQVACLNKNGGPFSTTIQSDSQTALDISENPANYRRAKHIDICYHAVRHYIHDGKIEVDYIPSNYQPADLFTKALGPSKHHQFCLMVGLRNRYEAFEDVEHVLDRNGDD